MDLNIPYAIDENLPSTEKVKKGFEIIDSLNTGELSYEAIRKILFDNLGTIPQIITPESNLIMPIYRTSIIDNNTLDIENIQSFSHPPLGDCPKGRCNLKDFPVFYASISVDTALRERKKYNNASLEDGDEIYISHWKVNDGINFRYSRFLFGEDAQLGQWLQDMNQNNHEKLKEVSQSYSQDKQDAFKNLNNTLSKYFVADNYNISSFLGHYLLYEGRDWAPLKADAVMYPSIQAGLNSINFAIHPDFVKSHLKLIEVQKVRFGRFVNNGSELTLLERGIPNGQNKIEWFTPRFNLSDMKIMGIEIVFDVDPNIPKLSDANEFYKNDKKVALVKIAWEYINERMKEVLNILSSFKTEIDFEQSYEKDIFITPEKNVLYLDVNDKKYFITTLKVAMKYKISLQKI